MSDSTEPTSPTLEPISPALPEHTGMASTLASLAQPNNLVSSLKWGGLVALIYYVVSIPLIFLLNLMIQAGTGLFATVPACILIFGSGFALYAAGYQPANERGSIIIGMAGAFVMLVVAEVLSLIYHPAVSAVKGAKVSSGATSPGILVASVVLYIAVTLLIGWAGASMGAKNHAKRLAASDPVTFTTQ